MLVALYVYLAGVGAMLLWVLFWSLVSLLDYGSLDDDDQRGIGRLLVIGVSWPFYVAKWALVVVAWLVEAVKLGVEEVYRGK